MKEILTELKSTLDLHTPTETPHIPTETPPDTPTETPDIPTATTNNTDDAMQTLNSAFIASHSPDGFLLALYDIMKAKTPKKLYDSSTLYNCDLQMSESSVSIQTEHSQPHSEKLELPTQKTEHALQPPQYTIPDQETQHPLQSDDPTLLIDQTQQFHPLDPIPKHLISSFDEHTLRRCKFQIGRNKSTEAHICIKYKESCTQISVQPLVEGYPEGDPTKFTLYEICDLYIDSSPSRADHLFIQGFGKNDKYDSEPIHSHTLRIMMYKNQSNQPDPQATYALFEYIKSKLDHPQK